MPDWFYDPETWGKAVAWLCLILLYGVGVAHIVERDVTYWAYGLPVFAPVALWWVMSAHRTQVEEEMDARAVRRIRDAATSDSP